MIFFVSLAAGSTCDRVENYDLLDPKSGFELDLTSHTWNSALLGKISTLYFQEDGIALVMPQNTSSVESYTWEVQLTEEGGVLRVFSGEKERTFFLSPTCDGLVASECGKSVPMFLNKDADTMVETSAFMESQITGTWQYIPSQQSLRKGGNAFTLSLHEDGTFLLVTDPDIQHSSKDGVWQLSPDGAYLVLFTREYVGDRVKYIPETVILQALDFEDMVIGGLQLPRMLRSNAQKQPLYLSKVLI